MIFLNICISFAFFKSSKLFFKKAIPITTRNLQVYPHPHSYMVLSDFQFVILMVMWRYFTVVLICIPLVTNEAEHILFAYL